MTNKSMILGHEKVSGLSRRSYDKRSSNMRGKASEKLNCCVIVPTKVDMVADTIERKDHNWYVRTKVATDLVVQIGKKSKFHLHILPMVARSTWLNRIIFEKKKIGNPGVNLNIKLDNFPGGADIFELIVKFCYGWKVDLTANNAAPLYCAANFLEMDDDLVNANLISRTETFLTFLLISSWKDTFIVLKACESISSSARDLQIQRRCSEAIAWKVSTDPKAISLANDELKCFNFLVENDLADSSSKTVGENWWFDDVSALRIDHFIEVVASCKRKGIRADVLGSCIAYWTAKWLAHISFGVRISTHSSLNHQVRKVIVESLIRVLPFEEKSVSFNFLLHLLKLGLMMKVDVSLTSKLERRIASSLEQCQPLDLLVKNFGESETLYDVSIVTRIIEVYVSLSSSNPSSKIFVLGRLVDGYMTLVAKDRNLQPEDFKMLAESLPKNARYSDDNFYKAIDRYLKAHPDLTEEERKEVCRGMEYHKLSKEAREHAMMNGRLPVSMTTQFLLLEQVNMMNSMVNEGSVYIRTKAQTVINLRSNSRKDCLKVHNQVSIMKHQVEGLKIQLNKLQSSRVELKRLAKRV